MANMQERRKYSRLIMQLRGFLQVENGSQLVPVKILDVSLKGALVELPPDSTMQIFIGQRYTCTFALDVNAKIVMHMACRHCANGRVGLECVNTDASSITHLKRLIELNIGRSELINRELSALMESRNYD